jgi:acyl-CoA reductase-like NAD-dependent aldehyde dehydrogenase
MINVINPARTSEVVGQVAESSAADVERGLTQADRAFKTWALAPADERASRMLAAARDLRKILPDLASLFTRENGKPIREAEIDIRRSIELMEIIAEDLREWSKPIVLDSKQPVWARRRARGVTAVISPWNSPVLLSFKRFVPAIATGSTAIVKPPSYCPLTLTECVRVINRHVPTGVLQVLIGPGSAVGERLITDDRVRTIAFTGSTETGRRIMELASRTVKKCFLELGGNDPALVLADAKLDAAEISRMTHAILRATGQVCIAIKRIYVHASRLNDLTEKLAQSFDQVVVGDGLVPETTMGPLNNKSQFDFVIGLVEKSVRKKLRVVTKGKKLSPSNWDEGYFMLPSIILDAREEDEIVRCEQFGPVIPIMPFEDENEAITRANSTPYGLRASVWTQDHAHAEVVADRLEAGAVFLNNHGIFQDLHIEFPGIKQSGFSRESRSAALDHYADTYGFAE